MATGSRVVKKIIIGIGAAAALFALFLWTLQETTSTPYRMASERLTGWRVVVSPSVDPSGPILSLSPPRELTMDLFQQLFERTMESMNAPATYGVALILQHEFNQAMLGVIDPEELADLARASGLEDAMLEPTCFAERTGSTSDEPRRMFYLQFDLPELAQFRSQVAEMLETRGGNRGAFEPEAVAPLLYLAATDRGFREWPPVTSPPADECVAPVDVSSG